jgi:anti-sigma B factor antagonist
MSDIKISLDTSGPKGELSVVRVDGVIDTMTATDLEKVMNSLLERKRYNIIIDLGGVDYISSAGWGIFISNIREIRQHSGDIKLARMIPNVYEIFELLEFDSILKAFDSVEKAKGDFDNSKKQPAESVADVAVAVDEAPGVVSPAVDPPQPIPPAQGPQNVSEARETKPARASDELPRAALEPSEVVLEMISKDPFLTISELKHEISRKYPLMRLGWWKIFGILRRENLLSKKSRFRKARLKAGGN